MLPAPVAPDEAKARDGEADAQAYERLAKLSAAEYDRAREREAAGMGIRVGTLDAEVRRARGIADAETDVGGVDLPAIEPWPEPVSGADMLAGLVRAITAHVILPSGAATAIALWVVHTHAHDAAFVSPILCATSPTPECGKTTLLTLLGALCAKPLSASNITAAATFRSIEKWRPTLIVDEADTFLRDNDELRGVINSGHSRATAYVIRTAGEDHEPRRFSTWAPKAIALIGTLPDTLASRAIHIDLRRKTAGETVTELRLDRQAHLKEHQRKAARWAIDSDAELRAADPDMPAFLSGRAADNWRAMLAIADAAGGVWPARARAAAELLSGRRDDETAAVVLLGDLRKLFADRKTDRLASADIIVALADMDDRPWPEWRNGKPITARQLARLLEPFRIRPGTRRDGAETFKGYSLASFDDAFGRYLVVSSVTPSQTSTGAGFRDIRSVTSAARVTDIETPKASTGAGCDAVTDRTGGAWHEQAIQAPGRGCTADEYARARGEV